MKVFYITLDERKKIKNCYTAMVTKEKIAQNILSWRFQEPLTEEQYKIIEWACKNAPRY